jgi:hypothetical protein
MEPQKFWIAKVILSKKNKGDIIWFQKQLQKEKESTNFLLRASTLGIYSISKKTKSNSKGDKRF